MANCIYDCAKCTLEVDKSLCCQFQTLRLLVEIKQMLKDSAVPPPPAVARTLADIVEENKEEVV